MALMPSVTHRGSGTDAKAVLGMIGDADGVGRVLDGVGSTLFVGRVEVTDEFVGYRRKRYDRVVQTCGLELPPVQFATVGVWCAVSRRIRDAVRAAGRDWLGGLHAAEHPRASTTASVATTTTSWTSRPRC